MGIRVSGFYLLKLDSSPLTGNCQPIARLMLIVLMMLGVLVVVEVVLLILPMLLVFGVVWCC